MPTSRLSYRVAVALLVVPPLLVVWFLLACVCTLASLISLASHHGLGRIETSLGSTANLLRAATSSAKEAKWKSKAPEN